jgi:hypothetical protein
VLPSKPTDEVRQFFGALEDPPARSFPLRVMRRLIREFLWVFIALMDLGRRFGSWLLRSEYIVTGGCKKRGACCHHILLEWTPMLDARPWLARLVLFKMTRIYNFYDRGYTWEVEDGFMARVLSCHSLRPDGSCGEYRIRPLICRSYPELPLIGKPMVLKGCGYTFARRDRGAESEPGLVQIGRPSRVPAAPEPDQSP